jgi:MurNAc alpha-1-phosphate uridylyltransferase
MKAMILAAGRGERMRPLTDDCPKPLLKVAGKRLIEYHLENLQRAGVQDVVINHAWLGEQFVSCLGDGRRYGLNIHYSNEGEQALETAGGIIHALPLLGASPFILVNGDIWTDYEFANLPKVIDRLIHIVLVNNPSHHPHGDFDLTSSNSVIDQRKFTYSGIGIYNPEIFTKLKSGIQPLAPIIREMIVAQQVSGEYYAGMWTDVGTPDRLHALQEHLLKSLG